MKMNATHVHSRKRPPLGAAGADTATAAQPFLLRRRQTNSTQKSENTRKYLLLFIIVIVGSLLGLSLFRSYENITNDKESLTDFPEEVQKKLVAEKLAELYDRYNKHGGGNSGGSGGSGSGSGSGSGGGGAHSDAALDVLESESLARRIALLEKDMKAHGSSNAKVESKVEAAARVKDSFSVDASTTTTTTTRAATTTTAAAAAAVADTDDDDGGGGDGGDAHAMMSNAAKVDAKEEAPLPATRNLVPLEIYDDVNDAMRAEFNKVFKTLEEEEAANGGINTGEDHYIYFDERLYDTDLAESQQFTIVCADDRVLGEEIQASIAQKRLYAARHDASFTYYDHLFDIDNTLDNVNEWVAIAKAGEEQWAAPQGGQLDATYLHQKPPMARKGDYIFYGMHNHMIASLKYTLESIYQFNTTVQPWGVFEDKQAKIQALIDASQRLPDGEWMWFMEGEVLFQEMDKSIRGFLAYLAAENYHVSMAEWSCDNTLDPASLIIRNSELGRQLLLRWRDWRLVYRMLYSRDSGPLNLMTFSDPSVDVLVYKAYPRIFNGRHPRYRCDEQQNMHGQQHQQEMHGEESEDRRDRFERMFAHTYSRIHDLTTHVEPTYASLSMRPSETYHIVGELLVDSGAQFPCPDECVTKDFNIDVDVADARAAHDAALKKSAVRSVSAVLVCKGCPAGEEPARKAITDIVDGGGNEVGSVIVRNEEYMFADGATSALASMYGEVGEASVRSFDGRGGFLFSAHGGWTIVAAVRHALADMRRNGDANAAEDAWLVVVDADASNMDKVRDFLASEALVKLKAAAAKEEGSVPHIVARSRSELLPMFVRNCEFTRSLFARLCDGFGFRLERIQIALSHVSMTQERAIQTHAQSAMDTLRLYIERDPTVARHFLFTQEDSK